jgi:hypothetical protein
MDPRYVFTGYNLKDAEQADVVEIAVYATNEGEALAKAAKLAVREHYKTEAVEELPQPLEDDNERDRTAEQEEARELARDDVAPGACRDCEGYGDCGSTPDVCDVMHPDCLDGG